MSPINILIPLETSSRELLYKVYLCNLLSQAGFSCYLGSKSNIYALAKKLENYVYLDKGYHAGVSEKLYKQIKKNNGVIVNLDEEGAVDFVDNSTLNKRYGRGLFDHIDIAFLWGAAQYKLIKEQIGQSSKMAITGHPRFELLKPRYHYLYRQAVHEIRKNYGAFILVNTNMGFGNNMKGDHFVFDNYVERFKNIEKIIAFDKLKYSAFVELVIELSRRVSKKIIVRPHPEEDLRRYEEDFKDMDNIQVIYSGSVVPWLLAADDVIHPDCTTAIETSFLGKLPISFMPKNYPTDIVTKIPLEVSLKFTDTHSIVDYLMNEKNESEDRTEKHQVLNDYFSYDRSSIDLILKILKDIGARHSKKKIKEIGWHSVLYLKFKEIYNFVFRSKDFYFVRKKLQGFNKESIEVINETLVSFGDFDKLNLLKYNNYLYMFKKDTSDDLRKKN